MPGRQARKTCHQHIGSVPWHGQNPWAVSWSGIMPNGMSQLYSGLLFGLPLAVTSFNRFSRLLESLCRRLGGVLISFYFDDLMQPSRTPAQPKGLANGQRTIFAVELDLHSLLRNNNLLCSQKALSWGSLMTSAWCSTPTASCFGPGSDFTTRSKTSSTLLETQLAFLEVSHRKSTEWPIFWSRGFSVE